jgi:ankyrin repeat protein
LLSDLLLTDPKDDLAKTLRLKGERIEGTCKWVLERDEFNTWAGGESFEPLWIIGAPGIGKTVISCFLVEEFQRRQRRPAINKSAHLAYYFCDNKDDRRKTNLAILRGILLQLFRQRRAVFGLVEPEYKLKKASVVENVDVLWRWLVKILKSCSESEVYILIDAIDECEKSSRRELFSLIRKLDQTVRARFIITGRPESDIEDIAHIVGQTLRLDSGRINHDLSKFIDAKLKDLAKRKKHYPRKLLDDIRAALHDQAGGTFLWVSLVLEDIVSAETTKAAREKLRTLPAGLSQTYTRILDSISDREHAMTILRWIAVSRSPMTVAELATVQYLHIENWEGNTAPSNHDVADYLDGYRACGPLLFLDTQKNTVNLIHQSAKDYLLALDASSPYHIDVHETALSMLDTCWRYLRAEVFELIISRDQYNLLQWRPAYKNAFLSKKYMFLEYASLEFMDFKGFGRCSLIAEFIGTLGDMDKLPALRDYLLVKFVTYKHVKGVQASIDKKADITTNISSDSRPPYADSPPRCSLLHRAVKNIDISTSKLLLEAGAAVSVPDDTGATPLHIAARLGSVELCQLLIETGAKINAEGTRNDPGVLHEAAKNGHVEALSLLLEAGAHVDALNRSGHTAFFSAVVKGQEEVATFLLGKKADSRIPGSFWSVSSDMWLETSALLPAAASGDHRIVEILLKQGLDVNERIKDTTPLSAAVWGGHRSTVRLLIDAGADWRWTDSMDRTLVDVATSEGHLDVLRILLDEGLDVDSMAAYPSNPGERRKTPLMWAILRGDHDVVEVLVQKGANILQQAADGLTPLHFAATCGREIMLEKLLAKASVVDKRDDLGRTALQMAVRSASERAVSVLIAKGANVNCSDDEGFTALHHAINIPDTTKELVSLLLRSGAEVNARTKLGRTPIYVLARRVALDWKLFTQAAEFTPKFQSIIDLTLLLLQNGADVNARSRSGQAPLDLLSPRHHQRLRTFLIEHGATGEMTDEAYDGESKNDPTQPLELIPSSHQARCGQKRALPWDGHDEDSPLNSKSR